MNQPAPTNDVWTVQKILSWTTDYLQQQGVDAARLEAELLCAHARQCQRIRLYTDFDVPLTDDERSRMRDYVRQRAARVPLAYITGKREFYGRNFAVGPGVLIPRPETEVLIDLALERMPDDTPVTLAEAGFGSGCISITLAVQKPKCHIIAGDLSTDCFPFAEQNAATHEVQERIQFVCGNGLQPIRDALTDGRMLDGFVSNPPYVCDHEMADLQPEVAEHEPGAALVSGVDGLDLIRELIPEAAEILRPGGWMALECDPQQCHTVVDLMLSAGLAETQIHRDHRDVDRIVTCSRPE